MLFSLSTSSLRSESLWFFNSASVAAFNCGPRAIKVKTSESEKMLPLRKSRQRNSCQRYVAFGIANQPINSELT